MKKGFFLFLIVFSVVTISNAQTDGLSLFDDEPETEYVTNAFKSSRVINGQSMEMIAKGALDFRIMHRFGLLNDPYNFFGLDQASMRMSFDYGIMKNLTVGVGRSTFKKELDGFLKLRILQQSKGKKVILVFNKIDKIALDEREVLQSLKKAAVTTAEPLTTDH